MSTSFADIVERKVNEFHAALPLVGAVETLIDDTVVDQDAALRRALELNKTRDLVPFDVSPAQGKLLQLLAVAMGARTILEIGTLGGYSTIWLARALPLGGRVVSLEKDAHHAAVARENLEAAGLADRVTVVEGDALETLPRLAAEHGRGFDLAFIDADKDNDTAYLEWSTKLVRPDGLVIVDNIVRFGGIVDPAAHTYDPGAQGSRAAIELLAAHPALDATVIQTVGSKGWDGFGFATVK